MLPAGQAYPGAHGPTQAPVVAPAVSPNRPGSHSPLQFADVSPAAPPKAPGGHEVHSPAAPVLYRPTGHTDAVALVDPVGQAYPAAHGPAHVDPAAPAEAPKRPAGHGVQAAAPAPLYVPGGHSPLHTAADSLPRPRTAPKVPPGHGTHGSFPEGPYRPGVQCVLVNSVSFDTVTKSRSPSPSKSPVAISCKDAADPSRRVEKDGGTWPSFSINQTLLSRIDTVTTSASPSASKSSTTRETAYGMPKPAFRCTNSGGLDPVFSYHTIEYV